MLKQAIAFSLLTIIPIGCLELEADSEEAGYAAMAVDSAERAECVDGLSSYCGDGDAKERWTGTQCCVQTDSDELKCVGGTFSACGFRDAKAHWTGKKCCVEGVTACGPGNPVDCRSSGMHWTGKHCCL